MSTQITTAMKQQYKDNIQMLQQQMGSNLRGAVDVETVNGEFTYFDQISATAMSEVSTRHGDTEYTDTPHSRRRVSMTTYAVNDLVDRADVLRTITSPTSAYARNMASAANRQIDDTIISAFDATVATGKTGTGTDAFDTTNYQVAVGTSNLTTAKLRTARRILEAAENPEDDGDNQWYCVCSAEQREGLLGSTDFTSSDFNSVRALVDGSVDSWLGFKFLKSERLPEATGNIRSVFCWRKQSMKLAIGADVTSNIDILPGKNHSTQISYKMDIGAVRMDQVGVVEILCDEDL